MRKTVGKKLKAWRERVGTTQTEAAKAACISQSVWSDVELDNLSRIGLEVARRIVEVTGGEIALDDFPRHKGTKVKPIAAPDSTTNLVDDEVLGRAAG